MKIAVKNLNNSNHTICMITGQRVTIAPKDYTIINTDDDREITFWTNLSRQNVQRYGLKLITSEEEIYKLECKKNNGSYDTSIVDGFVSPVARNIASASKRPDTTIGDNTAEQVDNNSSSMKYAEEELLQMDKADLFNLCDNFNISYKKNNSVKTLVKLLLEAGVLE